MDNLINLVKKAEDRFRATCPRCGSNKRNIRRKVPLVAFEIGWCESDWHPYSVDPKDIDTLEQLISDARDVFENSTENAWGHDGRRYWPAKWDSNEGREFLARYLSDYVVVKSPANNS